MSNHCGLLTQNNHCRDKILHMYGGPPPYMCEIDSRGSPTRSDPFTESNTLTEAGC